MSVSSFEPIMKKIWSQSTSSWKKQTENQPRLLFGKKINWDFSPFNQIQSNPIFFPTLPNEAQSKTKVGKTFKVSSLEELSKANATFVLGVSP